MAYRDLIERAQMDLDLLAFSVDFGEIRHLIVGFKETGRVSILAKRKKWRLPPLGDRVWQPYWTLHSATNKQGFKWIVQPTFDDFGFVKNAFQIGEDQPR